MADREIILGVSDAQMYKLMCAVDAYNANNKERKINLTQFCKEAIFDRAEFFDSPELIYDKLSPVCPKCFQQKTLKCTNCGLVLDYTHIKTDG